MLLCTCNSSTSVLHLHILSSLYAKKVVSSIYKEGSQSIKSSTEIGSQPYSWWKGNEHLYLNNPGLNSVIGIYIIDSSGPREVMQGTLKAIQQLYCVLQ